MNIEDAAMVGNLTHIKAVREVQMKIRAWTLGQICTFSFGIVAILMAFAKRSGVKSTKPFLLIRARNSRFTSTNFISRVLEYVCSC